MSPDRPFFSVYVPETSLPNAIAERAAEAYGDALAEHLGGRDQVKPTLDACDPMMGGFNREECTAPQELAVVDRLERAERAAWAAAKAVWADVPNPDQVEIYFQIVYLDDERDNEAPPGNEPTAL